MRVAIGGGYGSVSEASVEVVVGRCGCGRLSKFQLTKLKRVWLEVNLSKGRSDKPQGTNVLSCSEALKKHSDAHEHELRIRYRGLVRYLPFD